MSKACLGTHSSGDALARRIAALVEHSEESAFVWELGDTDVGPRIVLWSRGAGALYGYGKDEALGRAPHILLQTSAGGGIDTVLARVADGLDWSGQLTHRTRAGASLTVDARMTVSSTGRHRSVLQTGHNIEQQTEALGRLASGIAHDFNNLLMVIIGNLDLMESRATNPAKRAEYATDARDAAERGAALTRQLLAFGSKSTPATAPHRSENRRRPQ